MTYPGSLWPTFVSGQLFYPIQRLDGNAKPLQSAYYFTASHPFRIANPNGVPLKSLLAILLVASLLLQGFSPLVIVVNYQLNQEQITALFCVNKRKPASGCHGQCYLKKQLDQADGQSVPLSSLKTLLELDLFTQPLPAFAFTAGVARRKVWGFYPYPLYPSPSLAVLGPPKIA